MSFRSLLEESRAPVARPAAKPYTPPTLMPTSPPALTPVPVAGTPPVPTHHLQLDPSQSTAPQQDQPRPLTSADRIRMYRDTYENFGPPPQQNNEQRPSKSYLDATPPRYLR